PIHSETPYVCRFSFKTPENKHENKIHSGIGYQPSTLQIAEIVAACLGGWWVDLEPFWVKEFTNIDFPSGIPQNS
ncbi:MAG: hypothetical protein WBL87_01020, partial [Methanothrix sp.]